MRHSPFPSPISRAVLRPRDPVTELVIVATVVLGVVSLLLVALARLLT